MDASASTRQRRSRKNKGGRPSDFKTEFNDQVYRLCLLKCSDSEIADFFRVKEQTINRWKKKHPRFCESMRRGKIKADADVSASLVERAMGYSHPDIHIAQYEGRIIQTKIIKHYPPDTAAASLWLRNRQPDKWRDKPEVAVTVHNSVAVDLNQPAEECGVAELEAELARRGAQLPKIPIVKIPVRNGERK